MILCRVSLGYASHSLRAPRSADAEELHMTDEPKAKRGFAAMDPERLREIAKKGGANVPHERRPYARDRKLAAEAGRKGGLAKPKTRSPH